MQKELVSRPRPVTLHTVPSGKLQPRVCWKQAAAPEHAAPGLSASSSTALASPPWPDLAPASHRARAWSATLCLVTLMHCWGTGHVLRWHWTRGALTRTELHVVNRKFFPLQEPAALQLREERTRPVLPRARLPDTE